MRELMIDVVDHRYGFFMERCSPMAQKSLIISSDAVRYPGMQNSRFRLKIRVAWSAACNAWRT
jgi:hypothetical protein